jgi:hypothetical protein
MSKHKTARGKEFNMQAFTSAQGAVTAVGNSSRNARGDLVGPGGKILATAQEITNKVHDRQSTKTTKASASAVNLNQQAQQDVEVDRKEIIGADGVSRWEITYADGSVEMKDNWEI